MSFSEYDDGRCHCNPREEHIWTCPLSVDGNRAVRKPDFCLLTTTAVRGTFVRHATETLGWTRDEAVEAFDGWMLRIALAPAADRSE